MARYLALVDGKPGAYGVRIPDFPGCFGGGATIEAAVDDATRALCGFAADMATDGEPIPAPRTCDSIEAELRRAKELWGAVVYVPLKIGADR